MSTLICRRLSFGYPGADQNLFTNLDLLLDTSWRTCLTGRNGRGKSTLMQLLSGALAPDSGSIETANRPRYFPSPVKNPSAPALTVAKDAAGPYRHWEQQMNQALKQGDAASLARYGELLQSFEAAGGYDIDARLAAEFDALDVSDALRNKPFAHLSGGEQTRTLLAALFVGNTPYPLIDEPTNHLDRRGRELLGDYLASKPGFLLVSHDRAFVDRCADHVLALNPDSLELLATGFSQWRAALQTRLTAAAQRNTRLKGEIEAFEATAKARREGADAREARKSGAVDKGYEGARAARQMKRALTAERRADAAANARREALTDTEKHYPLKFSAHSTAMPTITASNLTVYRQHALFQPVSFTLAAGERLAITGPNGSGKSSLLECLAGNGLRREGTLRVPERIRIGYLRQEPLWQTGQLSNHLPTAGLDESAFRQVLAALGLRGDAVEISMEQLSHGQRKKIDLARTLCEPSDLLIWDEPLNYLDIDARESLERAIEVAQPTLIIVEHDATFVDRIATQGLALEPLA